MVNPIIERALKETVWRYGQTISPGFHPDKYAGKVKEANSVFHFVNALEQHCAFPVSYREFSCDGEARDCGRAHGRKECAHGRGGGGRRVDAVVVSADSIYVIEAKGTWDSGMLSDLDKQICDFEAPGYSLRCYLVRRLVNRFETPVWGERSIRHLCGIVLANTFREGDTAEWMNLNEAQYPVLATYTRAAHECEQYHTGDGQEWFILSGYKRLSDPDGGISCKRDGSLPLSCPVKDDRPLCTVK